MKLTRIFAVASPFGRLEFTPAEPGVKVYWHPAHKKASEGYPVRIDWKEVKPTMKLARFYIRKAVAEDRGLPPYTYTDKNIDPPNDNPTH